MIHQAGELSAQLVTPVKPSSFDVMLFPHGEAFKVH